MMTVLKEQTTCDERICRTSYSMS